jgi:two-component system NtrC family sensor kinase
MTVVAPPPPPPAPVSTRRRVLLIDDEPFLLSSTQRLLQRFYDIETAGGGTEALARLEQDGDFAAIVCDLMMPDVDGAAIFQWLQTHRPALAARTIFWTGGTFTPRGFDFADMIGDRLLQKPESLTDLRNIIERVAATARP